jgi:hypothetical protein
MSSLERTDVYQRADRLRQLQAEKVVLLPLRGVVIAGIICH